MGQGAGHRRGSSRARELGRPAPRGPPTLRAPWVPASPPTLAAARLLRQSSEVLQLPGCPPAWEHWRENSARVLQTQEVPDGHWQRSCTHACTYSSSGTRPRQSAKAVAVSSFSHSARCGRTRERGEAGPCPPLLRVVHRPPAQERLLPQAGVLASDSRALSRTPGPAPPRGRRTRPRACGSSACYQTRGR